MTLDDYLDRERHRIRMFEHYALKQQNAEQLSIELPDFEWERCYAAWLAETEGETDARRRAGSGSENG